LAPCQYHLPVAGGLVLSVPSATAGGGSGFVKIPPGYLDKRFQPEETSSLFQRHILIVSTTALPNTSGTHVLFLAPSRSVMFIDTELQKSDKLRQVRNVIGYEKHLFREIIFDDHDDLDFIT
jgi:hypothetical protein